MLTEIQKNLLEMMKEIDVICSDCGINYTLGGGTAIGAIRHGGFIPWDDDIDLYMTRDNWEKFIQAYNNGKFPKNRVLESAETDVEYSNTFGRYVATNNTAIHSHQIISKDAGGYVLDIFVFDPIHIQNIWKFLEDFELLSDLMNETMGFSTRFDMNIKRYDEYYHRIQAEGKETVIKELIQSFTSLNSPGWNHYVMEWGTAPFVFPASIFNGGYTKIPFEDTSLQIVNNYSEYLTWQYGDEWQYIPKHEGREGHDAVFSSKIPYDIVRKDYLPLINQEELHEAYIRRKRRLLRANPKRRATQVKNLKQAGAECVAELKSKLEEKGLDIERLRKKVRECEYAEISELFSGYFNKQLSEDFIGRHDKHSTLHRFYKPVLIEIPDDLFEIAVELLIRTERMSKAKRLIDVYEGYSDGVKIGNEIGKNDKIQSLKKEIIGARHLINNYSKQKDEKLYREILDYLKEYPENTQIQRLRLRLLIEKPEIDNNAKALSEALIQGLRLALAEVPKTHAELDKYEQDIKGGDAEKYIQIYNRSENGFIKREIEKAGFGNISTDENESDAVIIERKTNDYSKKNSIYRIVRDVYRKIAEKDDKIKERAWQIVNLTKDRIELLDYYEDKISDLKKCLDNKDWDGLEKLMKPHQDAVLRNYELGFGLSVHPVLTGIQKALFIQQGKKDLAHQVDALIPEHHRRAIGS